MKKTARQIAELGEMVDERMDATGEEAHIAAWKIETGESPAQKPWPLTQEDRARVLAEVADRRSV